MKKNIFSLFTYTIVFINTIVFANKINVTEEMTIIYPENMIKEYIGITSKIYDIAMKVSVSKEEIKDDKIIVYFNIIEDINQSFRRKNINITMNNETYNSYKINVFRNSGYIYLFSNTDKTNFIILSERKIKESARLYYRLNMNNIARIHGKGNLEYSNYLKKEREAIENDLLKNSRSRLYILSIINQSNEEYLREYLGQSLYNLFLKKKKLFKENNIQLHSTIVIE